MFCFENTANQNEPLGTTLHCIQIRVSKGLMLSYNTLKKIDSRFVKRTEKMKRSKKSVKKIMVSKVVNLFAIVLNHSLIILAK